MTTTILFVDMDDDAKEQAPQGAPENCPIATHDVTVNLKNRQRAIDKSHYGPENPALPNQAFWARLADMWDVTSNEARTSTCDNCAAFIRTRAMLACISQGLDADAAMAEPIIEAADLGFCEVWDFKCAAKRTCDAWIAGGPTTDETDDEEYDL